MTVVSIESIAAGGDGVGRLPDGMAVFVPRSAPGDVVRIEIIERKGRWCRGRALAVEQPGPDRTSPRCGHYDADRCGGCQLQHLTPTAQLAVKGQMVGDALRRIGGLQIDDPVVVASPSPWRYRTKITLRAARTPTRGGEPPQVGLHAADDPARVFPPGDCAITRVSVMRLWRMIHRARERLPSNVEAVIVREDRRGHRHVVIISEPPCDIGDLTEEVADPTVSWWWKPVRGAARVVAGPESAYPALAFEQSNADLAASIRAEAVRGLGSVENRVVWDLYGGVGDTARALARAGGSVWSVDVDRRAHEWARTAPGDAGAGRVTYVTGKVESVLARLPEPAAVVVNPPRTGLPAEVSARLADWGVGRVNGEAGEGGRLAYVSCDPATLSRPPHEVHGDIVRSDRRGRDRWERGPGQRSPRRCAIGRDRRHPLAPVGGRRSVPDLRTLAR